MRWTQKQYLLNKIKFPHSQIISTAPRNPIQRTVSVSLLQILPLILYYAQFSYKMFLIRNLIMLCRLIFLSYWVWFGPNKKSVTYFLCPPTSHSDVCCVGCIGKIGSYYRYLCAAWHKRCVKCINVAIMSNSGARSSFKIKYGGLLKFCQRILQLNFQIFLPS